MELIELKNHPFFTACQYHPEFLSRAGHGQRDLAVVTAEA